MNIKLSQAASGAISSRTPSTHFLNGRQAFNEPPLILIVDCDRPFRQRLHQVFYQTGYRVIVAIDAEDCLTKYHAHQPDLVVLDIDALQPNGFDCCQQLCRGSDRRGIGRLSMPVLVVTQRDDQKSIDQAFAAGICDYLLKPVNWPILQQRVNWLLQQSRYDRQMQQFNVELDDQVQMFGIQAQERTIQLYRALEFEATLKRITDRVRDSLDEAQILQTAVQELAWALNVGCCNASLYDHERRVATVHYEYSASIAGYQDRLVDLEAYPEIYTPLYAGQHLQFCSVQPNSDRGRVAMVACPMMSDHHPIGDLWLINPEDRTLNEMEIRLVKQVANQCAIAIRQARLYQAAQAQVAELEKLNQLKDDFLSTVSHELRTPMSNMRLAIQMMERLVSMSPLDRDSAFNSNPDPEIHLESESESKPSSKLNSELQPQPNPEPQKLTACLQILRDECEREIYLINDLLDLQQLTAGQRSRQITAIQLQEWLPQVLALFYPRVHLRQQTLQVELDTQLPPVKTDPIGLHRILSELLDNACKYTPPGGAIALQAIAYGTMLELVVTNSGVEIPATELPRVFDKFYRLPNSDPWKQGGTGLGLALTQRLVQHLGGTINVTSADGQTCFAVQLPIERTGRQI